MKYMTIIFLGFLTASCGQNVQKEDHLNLEHKLSGNWKTEAFDGELHEKWELKEDGNMQQKGYYIQKQDTLYSATTRIQKVEDDIILFSVIKNSNPKIFKAVSINEQAIVFENRDYKNPYQVKYEFIDNNNYRRTIRGYEKDSLVIYVFNFKKIKY